MHPIEHLRYVARARGADPAALVQETAHALSAMRFDPSGLVVACRRIVERHPDCAPLWWLCARLLTAAEPFQLAWELAEQIADDPTAVELANRLPDDAVVVTVGCPVLGGAALVRRGDVTVRAVESCHEATSLVRRLERYDMAYSLVPAEGLTRAVAGADLVLLEPLAVSPDQVLAPLGSAAAAVVAPRLGVPVWLVAGVGRRLPTEYLAAMDDRMSVGADAAWEVAHDRFDLDHVSHVVGTDGVVAGTAVQPECPMAPELLRPSHM